MLVDSHLQGFEKRLTGLATVALDFVPQDGAHGIYMRLYNLKARIILAAWRFGHFIK